MLCLRHGTIKYLEQLGNISKSVLYILQKFSTGDEVSKCTKFTFKSAVMPNGKAECFFAKLNSLFTTINGNRLYDEFKTLTGEEIGSPAWNEAKVIDGSLGEKEL